MTTNTNTGGRKLKQRVGSRAQVMHGSAKQTGGGLKKNDLKYNKWGKIVSKKASKAGKKNYKYLVNAGYKAKKGQFGSGFEVKPKTICLTRIGESMEFVDDHDKIYTLLKYVVTLKTIDENRDRYHKTFFADDENKVSFGFTKEFPNFVEPEKEICFELFQPMTHSSFYRGQQQLTVDEFRTTDQGKGGELFNSNYVPLTRKQLDNYIKSQ